MITNEVKRWQLRSLRIKDHGELVNVTSLLITVELGESLHSVILFEVDIDRTEASTMSSPMIPLFFSNMKPVTELSAAPLRSTGTSEDKKM